MRKKLFIIISFFYIFSLETSLAQVENESLVDLKKSVFMMGEGALKQFQTPTSLYGLPFAISSLAYSFRHDKRISNHERSKPISTFVKSTESMSILFNFPILPVGAYYLGRINNNEKLSQFGMETFSALYLALLESAALSLIPVHERPDITRVTKWESNFRGKSSFPSGHVIPFAVLTFKSFQFYGPYAATLPMVLTYLSSKQRIQDGKHYLSDVVGAVWLSYFASEGVRVANGYQDNHFIYRKWFQPKVQVGLAVYQNVLGPEISWSY